MKTHVDTFVERQVALEVLQIRVLTIIKRMKETKSDKTEDIRQMENIFYALHDLSEMEYNVSLLHTQIAEMKSRLSDAEATLRTRYDMAHDGEMVSVAKTWVSPRLSSWLQVITPPASL